MKTKYRQCKMEKKTADSTKTVVSWIPQKYAIMGKCLKLKNNDVWEDGFIVKAVSEQLINEPPDYRKGVRAHRERTGDSLRKQ